MCIFIQDDTLLRGNQGPLISLREVLITALNALEASEFESKNGVTRKQRSRVQALKEMVEDPSAVSLLVLQPTSVHIDCIFLLSDLCVILVELYKAKKAKINQALTKEAAMFRQRAQVAELKAQSQGIKAQQILNAHEDMSKRISELAARLARAEGQRDRAVEDHKSDLKREEGNLKIIKALKEKIRGMEARHTEEMASVRARASAERERTVRDASLQTASIEATYKENENLKTKNGYLVAQVDTLKAQLQNLELERDQERADQDTMKDSLAKLGSEINTLKSRPKELYVNKENERRALQRAAKAEQDADLLRMEVDRLKTALKRGKNDIRDLKRRNVEDQNQFAHKLNLGVHKRLDKAMKEKSDVVKDLDSTKKDLKSLSGDLKQAQIEITRLKDLNKSLHGTLAKAKTKHNTTNTALIKQLREEIVSRERELLRVKHEGIRKESKTREKEHKERLKLEEKVGQLQAKLAVAEQSREELSKQTNLSNNFLKKEHEELRRARKEFQIEKYKQDSEFNRRKRELDASESALRHKGKIWDAEHKAEKDHIRRSRDDLLKEQRDLDRRRIEVSGNRAERKNIADMSEFDRLQYFKDLATDLKMVTSKMLSSTKLLINTEELAQTLQNLEKCQSFPSDYDVDQPHIDTQTGSARTAPMESDPLKNRYKIRDPKEADMDFTASEHVRRAWGEQRDMPKASSSDPVKSAYHSLRSVDDMKRGGSSRFKTTSSEVDRLFDQMDLNRDGVISRSEFRSGVASDVMHQGGHGTLGVDLDADYMPMGDYTLYKKISKHSI